MTSLRGAVTWVDSAVLAPVYRDPGDGGLKLVLVLRGPRGIHGGQIAFPGGRHEPADSSLLDTALREAEEEVGLTREGVQVLEPLPVVDTMTTGFRIAPFLGKLEGPPPVWRRQESEIAEVLSVDAASLLQPGAHGVEQWHLPVWDRPRKVSFYRVGPHKLWGATYRIVHPLLPRLLDGEWEI